MAFTVLDPALSPGRSVAKSMCPHFPRVSVSPYQRIYVSMCLCVRQLFFALPLSVHLDTWIRSALPHSGSGFRVPNSRFYRSRIMDKPGSGSGSTLPITDHPSSFFKLRRGKPITDHQVFAPCTTHFALIYPRVSASPPALSKRQCVEGCPRVRRFIFASTGETHFDIMCH